MYKQNLASNNIQMLICHKIQPTNQQMTDVKLLLLQSDTWNHSTVWEKEMSSARLKMLLTKCV